MQKSPWSGFYKKGLKERQTQLELTYPHIYDRESLFLHDDVANNMIENCIGTLQIPLGLGLNLMINGNPMVVPMAIEEPSVIAACSGAAKTISDSNGFQCSTTGNIIIAQIQILDIPDDSINSAIEKLEAKKLNIIDHANQFCTNMKKRGGGVVDVRFRKIPRSGISNFSFWLVCHLHIDVCDSMGANCATTVAENSAPFIQNVCGGRIGFRIISNLCLDRMATARFSIPVSKLNYKDISGQILAERIVESYKWACDDPFRAVTHNKGIMNGIDAVALATGQDWRAIEASCHAWAALGDSSIAYRPLSRYWLEQHDEIVLCGELELPISVATQGGVSKTNPVYAFSLGVMKVKSSSELAMAMVSVGLAQNFGALRALASEGIQKGHMSLHARNIAIAAGAPVHAVDECVVFMTQTGNITYAAAESYLEAHKLQTRFNPIVLAPPKFPSMFYCEIPSKYGTPITLNVAFQTIGIDPVTINFCGEPDLLQAQLFGEKAFLWLTSTMKLLEKIEISTVAPPRSKDIQTQKLKLISILMNILTRQLLVKHGDRVISFFKSLLEKGHFSDDPLLIENLVTHDLHSRVALPLLFAIWQVFEYQIGQWVGHGLLARKILTIQKEVMIALTGEIEYSGSIHETFQAYMNLHATRFQVRLFLLCDAIKFDPSLLTPEMIEFIMTLGNAFEIQQIAAHDVSPARLLRDLALMSDIGLSMHASISKGVVNGFLFWLHQVKDLPLDDIIELKPSRDSVKFRDLAREFLGNSIEEIPTGFMGIDVEKCRQATQLYRSYYQVEWLFD